MPVFNNKAAEAAKFQQKKNETSTAATPNSAFRKAESTNSNSAFKVADKPVSSPKAPSAFVDHSSSAIKVNDALQDKKLSLDEIAKEVIQGKYGNGDERKAALEKAGYNYAEVQARVNSLLKSTEEIAREVIQGKWGNGAERKAALEKAGYDYNAVQAKVNELLK